MYQPPHWLEMLGARAQLLVPEPQRGLSSGMAWGLGSLPVPSPWRQNHSYARDSVLELSLALKLAEVGHLWWVTDLAMGNRAEERKPAW